MQIMSQMYAKSSIRGNSDDICVIYKLKSVTDVEQLPVMPGMTDAGEILVNSAISLYLYMINKTL